MRSPRPGASHGASPAEVTIFVSEAAGDPGVKPTGDRSPPRSPRDRSPSSCQPRSPRAVSDRAQRATTQAGNSTKYSLYASPTCSLELKADAKEPSGQDSTNSNSFKPSNRVISSDKMLAVPTEKSMNRVPSDRSLGSVSNVSNVSEDSEAGTSVTKARTGEHTKKRSKGKKSRKAKEAPVAAELGGPTSEESSEADLRAQQQSQYRLRSIKEVGSKEGLEAGETSPRKDGQRLQDVRSVSLKDLKAELEAQLAGLELRLLARLDADREHHGARAVMQNMPTDGEKAASKKSPPPSKLDVSSSVSPFTLSRMVKARKLSKDAKNQKVLPPQATWSWSKSGELGNGEVLLQTAATLELLEKSEHVHRRENLEAMHCAHGWKKDSDHWHCAQSVKEVTVRQWRNIFNSVSVVMILLNALMIAIETDMVIRKAIGNRLAAEGTRPRNEDLNQDMESLFLGADIVTLIWLLVEVVVNIVDYKWQFIRGAEWPWNIFDCIVLLASFLEVLFSFMRSTWINLSFLRLLRVARIARAVRLFRVIMSFSKVRGMLIAMKGSLIPLAWAMFFMLSIMYCVSVVIMQGLSTDLEIDDASRRLGQILGSSNSDSVFSWSPNYTLGQQLEMLYGSLGRSILTCFRAVIGELDFFVAVNALAEVSWWYAAVFVIFVAIMIFGVLNVLAGVFCDAAIMAAQQDRENMMKASMEDQDELVDKLTCLFCESDLDNDGFVSRAEFQLKCGCQNFQTALANLGIDNTEAMGLFTLLDDGGDGVVDLHEFVSGCVRIRGSAARAVDLVTLMYEHKKLLLKLETMHQLLRGMAKTSGIFMYARGSTKGSLESFHPRVSASAHP